MAPAYSPLSGNDLVATCRRRLKEPRRFPSLHGFVHAVCVGLRYWSRSVQLFLEREFPSRFYEPSFDASIEEVEAYMAQCYKDGAKAFMWSLGFYTAFFLGAVEIIT